MPPKLPLTFSTLLLLATMSTTLGQSHEKVTIIPKAQVEHLITDSIKHQFNLSFPIFRVYHYSDPSGQYYCVLTQSLDSIGAADDSFHYHVRAVNLASKNGAYTKTWELNDHINNESYESSIWFWTRYFEFRAFDDDSVIAPLIVYGTLGLNEYDDGRIKILIYYKGQKIGIRFQGTEDDGRYIDIDKAFYSLPPGLQETAITKMRQMEKNQGIIYPHNWEQGFKKHRLSITD